MTSERAWMDVMVGAVLHILFYKKKGSDAQMELAEPTLGRRRPLTNCARKKAANYVLLRGWIRRQVTINHDPISTWSRPTHMS